MYRPVLSPALIDQLITQGRELGKVGKWNEAIKLFDRLVLAYPNNANILTGYAKAMRDSHQYQRASNLFEDSLEIDPNDIHTVLGYIRVLIEQGRISRIDEILAIPLKYNPKNIY
ncbi:MULTISPECIES: tetratricopeptide repeat protein [Spirulina sp. CCY15215]|uniref:tetratricopeptide repeat protein n=1 Tax=Spirulina sp. CCY15215 TaxID=2767591 RepID=UPI001950A576|nr:tetratricopeptide repeat protein [Spirulina major]